MAKPDPAFLDPTRYPFACEIATRFADLDINQHLNNVALAGIVEDARVRFHAATGYHVAMAGWSAMVANLTLDFLGQGYYPAPVTVHSAAMSLGRTSYTLVQLVRQGGEAVALARSVLVCVREGRPSPVPDAFHESVRPWMFAA